MKYIKAKIAAAAIACAATSGYAQGGSGASCPAAGASQCPAASSQCPAASAGCPAQAAAPDGKSAQKPRKVKKAKGYGNRRTDR